MNWKKAMTQAGLTEANLSHSVRRSVITFNTLTKKLADREAKSKEPGISDRKKTSLAEEIETIKAGITALDSKLVKDMARLSDPAKKAKYNEMGARLVAKKGGAAQKPVEKTVAATKEVPSPSERAEGEAPKPVVVAPKPNTPPNPAPVKPVKTEKKKNNTGAVVFGVVVTVLTLGTIGYFKFFRKRA